MVAALVGLGAVIGSGVARSAPTPQEPPIGGEGVEADYLRELHSQVHALWAGLFVHDVAEKMPATNPINDRSRRAAVLFSVRWDGTPTDVTLVHESGVERFDRAARDAILRVDHFPVPPLAVLSDDGLAHFRWLLARDERLCSGGELNRFEKPLEEALPGLLIQGRVEEALWRLARRAASDPAAGRGGGAGDNSLALFARAWLRRPQPDPVTDGRAASVLARAGDRGQVPRLRRALGRRETVVAAAAALRTLNVDVCPLVREALGDRDPGVRQIAVQALGAAGGGLPSSSPCVQVLGAMVQDHTLDGEQRALAARAVAAASIDGARHLLSSVLGDEAPAVRAAAVSLLARPAGGRPALYRWLPFLHDPDIDVRAAAAAALVRSCGDVALDQLVLVWKEQDPRVAVAVARELGRTNSAASAAFLTRLAKRRDPEVRAATAQAVVARQELLVAARTATHPPSLAPAGAPLDEVTPAVRAVSTLGQRQAIEWVLAHYDRLDRTELIEVFGSWLSSPASQGTASVSAR
jgi:TonB family protein